MSNKEIIQGNNLKLQDCVDLANNLPEYQDIEPIYGTVDYQSVYIEKPENITSGSKLNYVYELGNYAIISWGSSKFFLYEKVDNNYKYITDINDSRFDGYHWPIIIFGKENTNNIFIIASDRGNSYNIYYTRIDLNDLSTSTGTLSTSGIGSGYPGPILFSTENNIVVTAQHTGRGSIYKFEEDDANKLTVSSVGFIYNASYCINFNPDKPMFIRYNSLAEVIITDNQCTTIANTITNHTIIGVNFYNTKVFCTDGVYELSTDLQLGEKLADVNINSASIICMNDKYYVDKNSSDDKTIYTFDETTNQFSEVEVITANNMETNYYHNMVYDNNNIYNFTEGNKLLGYSINNQNIYLNTYKNIHTSKILTGYDAYNSNGSPISGTMSNNGELTYTPSTEEQTIPEGYTSGGTIAPAPLTDTEYNECLTLSQQILGEISL